MRTHFKRTSSILFVFATVPTTEIGKRRFIQKDNDEKLIKGISHPVRRPKQTLSGLN